MAIKLFWAPISPPCRAVRFVLNALNIKINLEEVDILTKSYLSSELVKYNPQHTIPTLIDKDFIIWDSHAIAVYLIQKYAPNYALYASEPEKRAIIDQRLHFDSGILYPRLYNCVVPILFKREKSINAVNTASIKQAYSFMNTFLKQSSWLVGDQLTIADFSCMTTLSTLDYLVPIDQKMTPNLHRYLKQCQKLPHYEELNQEGLNKLGKIIQEKLVRSLPTGENKTLYLQKK